MAYRAINVNIGGPLTDGRYTANINSGSAPDLASVVADTAVLVADGAAPTQGHVNTLNGHVGPLNAAIVGDVTIMWNTSTVTSINQLKAVFAAALAAAQGGQGGLTP